jgi:hypothetical protein
MRPGPEFISVTRQSGTRQRILIATSLVQMDRVTFGSMYVHPQIVRHWVVVGGLALGVVCAAILAAIAFVVSRRPSANLREERRRKRLATVGRIVDGSVIDAEPAESTPQVIIYQYRIAGVTYECSQDVSTLGPLVTNLRLDYPVQVRYSRENPADSIVVAETWNGLFDGSSRQLTAVQTS